MQTTPHPHKPDRKRARATAATPSAWSESDPSAAGQNCASQLHTPWNAPAMQAVLDGCAIEDETALKKALRSFAQAGDAAPDRARPGRTGRSARSDEHRQPCWPKSPSRFALARLDGWLRSQYGQPIGEESGDATGPGRGRHGQARRRRTQRFVGHRPDLRLPRGRRNHRPAQNQQP